MRSVGQFLTARWKALAALVAGGIAVEVASALWPGNEVAAAVAVLLTTLAVHAAPANSQPDPAEHPAARPPLGRPHATGNVKRLDDDPPPPPPPVVL